MNNKYFPLQDMVEMSALSIWIQSLVGKNLRSGKIMYRSEQTYLVLLYMPVTEMEITKQYFQT